MIQMLYNTKALPDFREGLRMYAFHRFRVWGDFSKIPVKGVFRAMGLG